MTGVAIVLIMVSAVIVDAYPGTALALGILGYALILAGRRRAGRFQQ
jgi:hypothetical protein